GIEQWAERKLGLFFEPEQLPALRRRIQGLVDRRSLGSTANLLTELQKDPEAWAATIAETFATHHTGFFREVIVLDRITSECIPSFGRSLEKRRIWSAASSTGEEAYSVAMLLAEKYGAGQAAANFSILGTDLVQKVVGVAERGVYGGGPMKAVSAERRQKWFERTRDGRFGVNQELRNLTTFRRLNLMKSPWPFKKQFSIILCRNVLYYFDKPNQERILNRLYEACEPGGWLLTSVSESLHESRSNWKTLASGVHHKAK
ncbi:MAG: protein-glutamate O-methyltransferase CheR, partial [Myxococcota bacterium]